MEVVGAGEVVRREDALDGEVGTVRAAAHGGGLGFDAGRGEGVIEVVDAHAVVVTHGVGDVGVGVGELDLDTGFRMTEAEVFGGAHELFLLAFVEGLVVVADLHREDGLARVGLHRLEDHESLAVFGAFRRFGAVEHVDEVVHDEDRVDEDALGGHRVGRDALDRQLGVAGIERFPDHFAEFAAVDRVGEVDGELGEVHLAGALFAELFVGNEDDVDVAVRTVLARDDGEGRHDVGDGGLVVGAKHGRAVGDNDVVAHVAFDFRMFGRLEPDVLFLVEADVAALVVLDDLRVDVGGEADVDGVHVDDPADHRSLRAFGQVGGKLRVDDGMFVDFNVFKAHFTKFAGEHFGEFEFTRVARHAAGLQIALGGNGCIAHEAFEQCGFLVHGRFSFDESNGGPLVCRGAPEPGRRLLPEADALWSK